MAEAPSPTHRLFSIINSQHLSLHSKNCRASWGPKGIQDDGFPSCSYALTNVSFISHVTGFLFLFSLFFLSLHPPRNCLNFSLSPFPTCLSLLSNQCSPSNHPSHLPIPTLLLSLRIAYYFSPSNHKRLTYRLIGVPTVLCSAQYCPRLSLPSHSLQQILGP